MSDPERLEEWRDRLARFAARGELTVRDWCVREGVTKNQVKYWRDALAVAASAGARGESVSREVRAAADGGAMVPARTVVPVRQWLTLDVVDDRAAVSGPDGSTGRSSGVSVRLGPATVDLAVGFDADTLRAAVRVLGSPSC